MSFFSSLRHSATDAVKNATDKIHETENKTSGFVGNLEDKLSGVSKLKDIGSKIENEVSDTKKGISDAIENKISDTKKGISDAIENKISDTKKGISDAIENGISDTKKKISDAIENKISDTKERISDIPVVKDINKAYHIALDIKDATKSPVSALNKILPKNSELFSKIVDYTAGGVTDAQNKLNNSRVNKVFSFLASIEKSKLAGTTYSNLNYLNDQVAIKAPVDQDLSKTPTVSQLLNAANAEFTIDGTPKGLTPFLVNGKQLYTVDDATGMSSRVWLTGDNQVIISYQSTSGGDNMSINPVAGVAGMASNAQIFNQDVSGAQKSALKWANKVVQEAEARGIDTNNIFVTGHSLGGIEASYVAQQTGLGGIAFSATGIPSSSTAKGDGSNFLSIMAYGDPIASYASDTNGGASYVSWKDEGASSSLNHYGKVIQVGSESDNEALRKTVAGWTDGTFIDQMKTVGDVFKDFVKFHTPVTLASDLGVTLTTKANSNGLMTLNGANGTPANIGGDTIGQLTGSHSDAMVAQLLKNNSLAA
ncbi:hypothetical protein [Acetobacter sp. DsW_059]|uniref:hypothetical protein n=1 Tax=Acetobacter sp. DsW_059 TaxID=1670661 RepID=UPI000A3A4713|nr:hypothetical protein [Acetobacter sp. DsW_059]